MARQLRVEYEGAFYHVTCRGNERKRIFHSVPDREKFLTYLDSTHRQYCCKIHAWCLMDNHYHLMIETKLPNISRVMQRLNTSYTTYFNRKRRRVGHLFGGRPKIIVIEKDEYALQLSRYIHLNPVKAGIVSKPEDYDWSSYNYFIKRVKTPEFLETGFLLMHFGDKEKECRWDMKRFVEEGLKHEIENPFDDLIKGAILGSEGFEKWIRNTFILSKEDDREIVAIKKLKRVDANKINKVVSEKLNVKDRLTDRIRIYLFRKYSDKTLKEVGIEFGNLGVSGVSHVVRRLGKQRKLDKRLDKKIKGVEKALLSNGQA